MKPPEFEWDEKKAESNRQKHGIAFHLAAQLLLNPYLELDSPKAGELRKKAVGKAFGEIFTVIFVKRDARIRIISARKPSREERDAYDDLFGK